MARPDPLASQACATYLKALAEPDRLRIVGLLRDGPLNAGDVGRRLDLEQTNASHHLGVLRSAGLLVARREGRHVIYGLAPEIFRRLGGRRGDTLDFGCCRLQLAPA